jgi:hypothetical protein
MLIERFFASLRFEQKGKLDQLGIENLICDFQDGKKALELAMDIHHSAQHGTLVSF